ncbi:urea amidolyase associated protein UAAP1 [Zoogloea sp.]|uniref:urea amidolyase associated protein UAAP1 n=1 Tax=Zoogloea sp. TaxID=49181 RepID=UPI0025F6E9F9|nr:urea amidolyase associated protein UAAP1 [Zoogloea sp.]MCK6392451.1 urea carboxylase-associated family protein [Zoogloea sp.]
MNPLLTPTEDVDVDTRWQQLAADLPEEQILFSDVIPGGCHWSWRLPRGTTLRLVTQGGGANLSLVLYNARNPLERYNMPDSLKAQHTAHYRRGHVLMSDMGCAMASVTHDSLGWHDPLGLLLDGPRLREKYGEHPYQQYRNGMYRSGRDGLLIEIGKHGLSRRDLVAPVNFFSKVSVDEEGRFRYQPNHAPAGSRVELRLDMDVIVAMSTAPHPLDPRPDYAPAAVGVVAWRSGPAPADDFCRHFRPECARALHNTDLQYLA